MVMFLVFLQRFALLVFVWGGSHKQHIFLHIGGLRPCVGTVHLVVYRTRSPEPGMAPRWFRLVAGSVAFRLIYTEFHVLSPLRIRTESPV